MYSLALSKTDIVMALFEYIQENFGTCDLKMNLRDSGAADEYRSGFLDSTLQRKEKKVREPII